MRLPNRLSLITSHKYLIAACAALLFTPYSYASGVCDSIGTTYTVITESDENIPGSLRAAVASANAFDTCDRIEFSSDVRNIVLNDRLLISNPNGLEIIGNGSNLTTLSAPDKTAIRSQLGNLFISKLSINNSIAAVSKYTGKLILSDSIIDGNEIGVSVDAVHDTTISNTTIRNGTRSSAIIYEATNIGATYNLLIENSLIHNNSAEISGEGTAGLRIDGYDPVNITIKNTTFANNSSYSGAAISIGNLSSEAINQLKIINSTFSDNQNMNSGGAAISFGLSQGAVLHTNLKHSTIVNNRAALDGGAIYFFDRNNQILNIDHSVVANNSAATSNNISATITNTSYSWIGDNGTTDNATYTNTPTNSVTDGDASTLLLGDLVNNGGNTLTHLPQSGSPLIDAGDPDGTSFPTLDQRGKARVYGETADVIDIGSVEVHPASSSSSSSGGFVGLPLFAVLLSSLMLVRRRR